MEVLVGPGSALYGPDASSGVLALRTKDPRQFKGSTLEVTGGSRSYKDVQGRYANVVGNFGYKVSGEFQQANDWSNFLYYGAGGTLVDPRTATPAALASAVKEDALRDRIDWNAQVLRGTAAAVYYMGENRLEVNGGMSRTDGVGQTNVGRNQLRDWDYNTVQARYTTPHWYVNAYRSQSQSGTSFALNRFAGAQLAPANAGLNADSLRKLSDWPSDGRMYAMEVQGNYVLPMLRNTAVVFGAQYRNDVVSSARQWLTDRITQQDVSNAQAGIYAQATAPVMPWLDVVLAGRLDDPENYARQLSPKAGIVLKPLADQAFRVTFNRAYKSPTILQTNFFIPDWTSIISIYGNTTGFEQKNAAGTTIRIYQPLVPETNRTWEAGYKGILPSGCTSTPRTSTRIRELHEPADDRRQPVRHRGGRRPTFAVPAANPGGEIPVNAQGGS
jgi:iron complex outermembrane receptor protein